MPRPDDKTRVPFPGYTPRSEYAAKYTITQMGRVRRHPPTRDGDIVIPQIRSPKSTCLYVALGGGHSTKGLAKAVYEAFGQVEAPDKWVPWRHPKSRLDRMTGLPRCSVYDVYLVPCGQAQTYTRTGEIPADMLPIV